MSNGPSGRGNLLGQGIYPPQPRKPREGSIGRIENRSVFHGERRYLRIAHHGPESLTLKNHSSEYPPVIVSGCEEPHIGLPEPLLNFLCRFLSRSRSRKAGIGADSQKGRNGLPGQSYRLSTR
jgi:hypothetical protein